MTGKRRVHAALEGRPVDRTPVTVLYNQLYHLDHYAELTGRPGWESDKWRRMRVDEHVEIFRRIHELAPLEILQPQLAPPRNQRGPCEYVERDGKAFRRDQRSDTWHCLATVSGHASDYRANETQYVFDRRDVDERIAVRRAEDRIATGMLDYAQGVASCMGDEHFIMAGGVVGTLYGCHSHVGLTNLFAMLIEQPDLIEYLSRKVLEDLIEEVRALAAAGGDAIYVDDAVCGCDMISVAHYERFCLPYTTELVGEIHRLGHKAILIYYGGIADRLEQIASTGADGLACEASMKTYTNDVAEFARRVGGRITLFGNVDPIGVLQDGTDERLVAEVGRQARAGGFARGFIACTGSPITPGTPLARVRRFIELGRRHGAAPGGGADRPAGPERGR